MNRCGRKDCRACHTAWASREARRAAERLLAAQELYRRARRRGGGALKHWALSPPPELVRELRDLGVQDVEAELRKRARRVLFDSGFVGGLEVFHPWRTRARGPGRYRRGQNFFSPHFHVVGFGYMLGGEVVHARTGWVLKNIGVRGDPTGTVAYLLEHAGVRDGAHVVKWLGSVSYRKVVTEREERHDELVRCETCGRPCLEHPLTRDGDVDWSVDLGPYYAKVRKRIYRLADAPARVELRERPLAELEQ